MSTSVKNQLPLWGKLFLVGILLFGFFLRLNVWINHEKFAGDEGIQLLTANHLIRYGEWPKTGEISGIDANNKYIFHNGIAGLLVQTFFYFVGFMTPEGYSLVFVVISTLQILALYIIGTTFFRWQTGLLSALLVCLSPVMVGIADWTSQPMLCLYVSTLALAIISLAQNSKHLFWWLLGIVLSFFSVQLYPPSILMLPFWIGFHFYIWNTVFKSRLSRKGMGIVLLFLLILTTSFLWVLEFTPYANIPVVLSYLRLGGINISVFDFGFKLASLADIFIEIFHYSLVRWRWQFWGGFILLLLLSLRGLKNSHLDRDRIRVWFAVIGLYVVIVAVCGSVDRQTYLYPIIMLWIIGVSAMLVSVISIFSRHREHFYVALILAITILMFKPLNFRFIGGISQLQQTRNAAKFIYETGNRLHVDLTKIDLYVISQNDKWNWEAPMYWYLFEQEVKRMLVYIGPQQSKIERLDTAPPDLKFLICEKTYLDYYNVNDNFDCLHDYLLTRGVDLHKRTILRELHYKDRLSIYAYR